MTRATNYETIIVLERESQTYGQPAHVSAVLDSPSGRRDACAHIGAIKLVWRRYGGQWGDYMVDAVAVPPGTPDDSEDVLTNADRWALRVRKAWVDQYIDADIDIAWAEMLDHEGIERAEGGA